MNEIIPIVTITCCRDLPMLDLQAQSIGKYLDVSCPVYIIVNEEDPTDWEAAFNLTIKKHYSKHNLTILYRKDFDGAWNSWIASEKNPWSVGWEIQQILKLAISKKLDTTRYLILDSQNFLIKAWSPAQYGLINGKVPCRLGHSVMPEEIHGDYGRALSVHNPLHTIGMMSICTPIFLHTGLVQQLIDSQGSLANFCSWFKNASRIKSEFILYELWAEKHGGAYAYHYMIPEIEDWANPYLRDCKSVDEFNIFYNAIGRHSSNAWVSANHRSWGAMDDDQYNILADKLRKFNLYPNFNEYRRSYIDYKF
jgi:hypothetical protein